MGNIEELKNEYKEKTDVVFSEFIREKLDGGEDISDEELQELLDWSGDSDYVSIDDIRDRGIIILSKERNVDKDKTVFIRNYATSIIDTFEDFLSSKEVHKDGSNVEIKFNNPDMTGEEGEAIIYGGDFDNLVNSLSTPLIELAKDSINAKSINVDRYK